MMEFTAIEKGILALCAFSAAYFIIALLYMFIFITIS